MEVKNLIAQLKTAPPEEYKVIESTVLAAIGSDLIKRVREIATTNGKPVWSINALNIAQVAVEYDLDFKIVCQYFEGRIIRAGAYDNLIRTGLKVNSIIDKIREHLKELEKAEKIVKDAVEELGGKIV